MKHYMLLALQLLLASTALASPLDGASGTKARPAILTTQDLSDLAAQSQGRRTGLHRRQFTTNHFPKTKQYVTTHDPKTGMAVFSKALPETVDTDTLAANPMPFTHLYSTNTFPVDFRNDSDLTAEVRTRRRLIDPLGTSTGTILRFVDFAPGDPIPPLMHRTVTLDYAVVLEGTAEMILDSGERRTMNRGDVGIQRGTMHAWRNPSPDEWLRLLFVLQASRPVQINGKSYGEALGMVPKIN